MLPKFTVQGVLPPGIHTATFAEISPRYGRFQRTDQRLRLLAILEEFVSEVRSVAGYDGYFWRKFCYSQ